jgi:hypothetical protein
LVISILVGIAGLDTGRSAFVVSWSTVDTVAAGSSASIALRVAGSAYSVKSEEVCGTGLNT